MNVADLVSLLAEHHEASSSRIHLIPSENSLSLAAHAPYVTDALYRYSFTPETGSNWSWPGTDDFAAIERHMTRRLGELYDARLVDVRPISGINCMTLILAALAKRTETVFSIGAADGGHALTRIIGGSLGLDVRALPYDPTQFAVDVDELTRITRGVDRPVLYLDQFMCLFPHDLRAIRTAVGPDAVIHYDGSHVMGLIAGGQFQDPLREGADSLAGSTHKSFPGPHKAVILTNDNDLFGEYSEMSNAFVSHRHTADVIALAIATEELYETGAAYAKATVENAQYLSEQLADRGLNVSGAALGYTRSHQLWIDPEPYLAAEQASRALFEAGVVVNAVEVPYLPTGMGLRLGVQEVTRLGMTMGHMSALAELITGVVRGTGTAARNRALLDDLRVCVREGAGDRLEAAEAFLDATRRTRGASAGSKMDVARA